MKMGLHARLFESVLVFWLVLSELVASCPQTYESKDSDKPECSYNVQLQENNRTSEMLIPCCDFSEKLYSNRTYSAVTVILPMNCKGSVLTINYPLLVANSIVVKDTNLTMIKINMNVQYLKTIDMSSNKLTTIEEGLFNVFINITELNLRNNLINCIKNESLVGLTKLQTLDLSENKLKVINTFLEPLISLQQLNLSKNYIEFIQENCFNNSLLEILDISHNNLKEVGPGVLKLLLNLVQILLSDNPYLGGGVAHFDTQLLVGSGRRLQHIDISRTGLNRVPEAFTHSVRFLSLAGNTISAVHCGDFDSYPLLQSLDLSDNEIGFVEDDSLGRLEMLILLNFNNNQLTSVPKSLTEKLISLSINYNLINNLTRADFINLSNLNILLLQNNKIVYIEANTFADLVALKVLDISSNPIQTLHAATFDGPLSLQDLRLCYLNVLVPEKDGSFPMTFLDNLQMLHLKSSPRLARQLLADSAALSALSHLQYLDLRMNNISEIRNDLLFYLGQLKTLRLHGNGFNCSAELWLRDRLNWKSGVANSESCYYDFGDLKGEVECSCSFSKTFSTQNDSLPPINLNSTEIIMKLLKIYDNYKINSETYNIVKMQKDITKKDKLPMKEKLKFNSNLIQKNPISDYIKKFTLMPSKQIKINDAKNISELSGQNDYSSVQDSIRGVNSGYNEVIKYTSKHELSRRWNNPVRTTAIRTNKNTKRHINGGKNGSSPVNTKTLGEESIKESEYLTYQSDKGYLVICIGTASVAIPVMITFVLMFRLKQKRIGSVVEEPEQIEVAHISGGSWENIRSTDNYTPSSGEYVTLVM